MSDVDDVANRYARAFHELARDENAADAVEGDMRTLKDLLASSDDLRRLAQSPVFEASDKANGIDAVLEKAGAHTLTRSMAGLLARNGRLFALEGVAQAYLDLAAQDRGEVTAEAVSAVPLTTQQDTELRSQIERAVGKAVNLETSVDPSLLGGLIVKVGSRMMDSSLRTKLSRMQSRLKEA